MKLPSAFIALPYTFDHARLREEVNALGPDVWQPHPSGTPGNSAVPLITRDGTVNDAFGGTMAATSTLHRCPYTRQVMASFGEVLSRSRLMKLDPGCEVRTHVDFNYHWYSRVRVHVPVVTNPNVTFLCGDASVHMGPGECWTFDNWRPHNVVNEGAEPRIHLVIDTAGSSRFWRTLRQMAAHAPDGQREAVAREGQHVAYDPGSTPELLTEIYSHSPVMPPGELEALVRELLADLGAHPANDPAVLERYRTLLEDFTHDWREAWLLHGIQPSGEPRYLELIDGVFAALAPHPRALVAASNNVGANPIIVQRILRAALAGDQREAFVGGPGDPGHRR